MTKRPCGKCGADLMRAPLMSLRDDRRKGLVHRICPKRRKPRGKRKAVRSYPLRADLEVTKAAGFKDPRSYVYVKEDSSPYVAHVKLFGEDMSIQRHKVYLRDAATCGVSEDEGELDHFPVSRGKGGCDCMHNLRFISRDKHRARHVQPQFTRTKPKGASSES